MMNSVQFQCVAGEMRPSLLIAKSLVTTCLYKLLRLVFITVQRIYWQLNGTARQLREARLPCNYERSAQVLDVVLRHKFGEFLAARSDHFLCTHNRFENPQYIISNDNISLMTLTDRDAVFCETEEKGTHLCVGNKSLRDMLVYACLVFAFLCHIYVLLHYSSL